MKEKNLNQNLKKLNEIVDWFESQEEIDVEIALKKVKEATEILKEAKKRLKKVENEFEEIKKGADFE
jgi:exodeoxyribonuclease VII small subunit